jgi:hypothetical protein
MAFFDRLSVIALRVGETEQTLLQEVAAIRQYKWPRGLHQTYSFSFQKAKAMF